MLVGAEPVGAEPVGVEPVGVPPVGAEVVGVGAVRLSRLAWVLVLPAQPPGTPTQPLGGRAGVGTMVGTAVFGALAGAVDARNGAGSGLAGVGAWFR